MSGYRVTVGQESTGDVSAEYEFDTKDEALNLLNFLLQKEFRYDEAEVDASVRQARFIRWILNGKFIEMSQVPEPDPAAVEVARPAEPGSDRDRLLTLLEDMGTGFEVKSGPGGSAHVILLDAGYHGTRPCLTFGFDGVFRRAGYDSSS